MTVVVHDMDKIYTIRMKHEDDHVDFFFRQLKYSEKSEIVMKTTRHNQGIVTQDMNMSDYLAIQIALVNVEGLSKRYLIEQSDVDKEIKYIAGENEELFKTLPYKLQFCDKGRVIDKCIDEIFNTPFEDRLVYTAKHLPVGIPEKIIHPFTLQEIEGVEILQPTGGLPKKL